MKNGDKKHKELQSAAFAAGRRFGKGSGLESILSNWTREYLCDMTEEYWFSKDNISEADALAYPNARTAYELQQSPLGKALV